MIPRPIYQLVQLFRNESKSVRVDTTATNGAVIGTNLWDASGNLITQAQWNALSSPSSTGSSSFSGTTDDVDEGQYNLYFTDRRAQDAVGAILENTSNITLTYVDGTSIKADLTEPGNSGVGTLQAITIDVYGRITGHRAPTTDDLPQGATNLYSPIIVATAQTDLTYPMVVAIDGSGNAYYPDLTNPTDVMNIAGITLNAALTGAQVKVTRTYVFTEPAWSWAPGRVYCAQTGGSLTQTPPTSGAIVEVARVIDPTTLFVDVQPLAILL